MFAAIKENAAAQRGKGAMSSLGPWKHACPWSNWCLHERRQCRHIVWREDQGLASKIFPQRFSRRKSLCPSYVCTCCTLPSSQLSGSAVLAQLSQPWCDARLKVQQLQAQGNKPRERRGEPTGSRSPVKAWISWRTASNWAATQELLGKEILSWCSWENVGLFADHLSECARLLRRNTWADCNSRSFFVYF